MFKRVCRRMSQYDEWTKEQLIEHIHKLENNRELPIAECTSDFETRHIAIKIAYFGWDYSGFAAQPSTSNTIEHHLFRALKMTQLVKDMSLVNYSRCGRTDKGVSAFGNVISLRVRTREGEPIPYCQMLNRILPDTIRAISWAPVDDDFSARFSCSKRVYKYFIPVFGLDLKAMQEALDLFVGKHNFRNFCKLDQKPKNYEREILEAKIEQIDKGIAEITIAGTAFLWHQIRFMVHVLVLIGQKLEKIDLIPKLMESDYKPNYDLAPEYPLVLENCEFQRNCTEPKWQFDDCQNKLLPISSLARCLQNLYEKHAIKFLQVERLTNSILNQKISSDFHTLVEIPEKESKEYTLFEILSMRAKFATRPWGQHGTLFPAIWNVVKEKEYKPMFKK